MSDKGFLCISTFSLSRRNLAVKFRLYLLLKFLELLFHGLDLLLVIQYLITFIFSKTQHKHKTISVKNSVAQLLDSILPLILFYVIHTENMYIQKLQLVSITLSTCNTVCEMSSSRQYLTCFLPVAE